MLGVKVNIDHSYIKGGGGGVIFSLNFSGNFDQTWLARDSDCIMNFDILIITIQYIKVHYAA